jgi:hypothetical protein
MIGAYKYVFYKLYRLETLLFDTAPEYSALFAMVILQWLNIGLVIALIEWWTGLRFLPSLSRMQSACVVLVLVLPQYFLLVHRGKFKNIIRRFSAESSRRRIIGAWLVGFYVFLSFVLFFWSATLLHGNHT